MTLQKKRVVIQSMTAASPELATTCVHPSREEDYIFIKEHQHHAQKTRLAEYIVQTYVKDLDAVAIDAGSTQQLIVEKMMESRNFLSVLTNNMTAFMRNSRQNIARSANEFILTGGKYVPRFDALLGNETCTSFEFFHPTIIVIGVSGLVPEKGFFCHGNDEVNIKRVLFQKTDTTILIPADYSKLGRTDSYLFGETNDFRKREAAICVVITIAPPLPAQNSKPDEFARHGVLKHQYDVHVQKLRQLGVTVEEVVLPPASQQSESSS